MNQRNSNMLLGLTSDMVVTDMTDHGDHIEVFIRRNTAYPNCPTCASDECTIHDYPEITVRHTFNGDRPTCLTLSKRRFRCAACHHVFLEAYDFLCPIAQITQSLRYKIIADLMSPLSVTHISRINNIHVSTVQKVLDAVTFDKPYLPKYLCIDEFKGDTRSGKFHVCVVDGDNSWLTDVVPEHTAVCIQDYFKTFSDYDRRRVEFYCCDMHSPFITAAKKLLPNAIICIDKFHVVKNVTRAFQEVRCEVQDTVEPEQGKRIKRGWKLLLKRNDELDDEGRSKVALLTALHPDLSTAYDLLQSFYVLCDSEKFKDIRAGLPVWILRARNCELPAFQRCGNTLKLHQRYILNTFEHGKTNAIAEGMNNCIKVLKRMAYGFHDYAFLRKRALMWLGPHRLENPLVKLNGRRKIYYWDGGDRNV